MADRFKNSSGAYRRPVYLIAFVEWVGQFPKQVANIETAGGVADQRKRIALREFATRNTFGKIVAQSRGSRRDGGGGKIVEVMQHSMFAALAGLFPVGELRGYTGIVFKLAKRVESGESGDQHDVHTGMRRAIRGHDSFPRDHLIPLASPSSVTKRMMLWRLPVMGTDEVRCIVLRNAIGLAGHCL